MQTKWRYEVEEMFMRMLHEWRCEVKEMFMRMLRANKVKMRSKINVYENVTCKQSEDTK
jgi:hypothetical protein